MKREHRAWCLTPGCSFDVRGSADDVERAAEDHAGQSRRKGRRTPGHSVVQCFTGVVGEGVTR